MVRKAFHELIESTRIENQRLDKAGLVLLTFGNVSAFDKDKGIVAIKPSGVPYAGLRPEDIVLTDLAGAVIESRLRPSSDLPTHLELYRSFPEDIGAVVHSHSTFATAFAQAGRGLPPLGTTHADFFKGEVPVTDQMSPREIESNYEANTGKMIVRKFEEKGLSPAECPAVLVAGHGPFCWGANASEAVENAIALEEICKMAWLTLALSPDVCPIGSALLAKHFLRKHGSNSYYGQKQ